MNPIPIAPSRSIRQIALTEILDRIDDCNWSEWACEVELQDGTVLQGCSVQSDGHEIAYETLTDEVGNKLDLAVPGKRRATQ